MVNMLRQSARHSKYIKIICRSVHDSKKKKGSGYLDQRLEGLKEDANLLNPQAMKELRDKMIKATENSPKQESDEYQRAMSIVHLPDYADKQTRYLAMSKPWTGNETPNEITTRLKKEAIKKPKPMKRSVRSNRLNDAKEGALNYRLDRYDKEKKSEKEKKDQEWREMYKERLLGPTMLISDTFTGVDNTIKSLADQKIMEAQRRGDFKNIHRGKPLKKDFTSEGEFIDRTEYHLNKILKSQDAIPPWIEKQGSVTSEIQHFRDELDRKWALKAVSLIRERHENEANEEELIEIAEQYARGKRVLNNSEWENELKEVFLSFKIEKLNSSIRSYNLQSPIASQRLYLDENKELKECYKRVNPTLGEAFKQFRSQPAGESENFFGKSPKIPQYSHIPQIPTEPLTRMFIKLFKRKDGN